jgi:cytoskeletal protein RodZ
VNEKRNHVGQTLKESRLKLGFDLDTLEMKTKIRKRYLAALEDGDWDVLPGDVYARGFIRSYAEAVGLDGRALLRELDEDRAAIVAGEAEKKKRVDTTPTVENAPTHPVSEPSDVTRVTRPRRESRRPMSVRPGGKNVRAGAGQAVLVVGMLALLGVGWYLVRGWTGGSADDKANHTAVSGNSTNQPTQNAGNQTGQAPGNTQNQLGEGAGTGKRVDNTTGGAQRQPAPVQIVQQPGATTSAVSYNVTTQDPLKIQVSAVSGPCWVSVSGDGRTIDGSDLIPANGSKSWQANQSVTIYFGHLNGVTVTVNGQPVPIPSINNPVHVTFNKQASGQTP